MAKAYTSTRRRTCRRGMGVSPRLQRPRQMDRGLVVESKIEDGLRGDQVGCVRSFKLGDGEHLRERMLSHSDVYRMYTYKFEKKPFDVDNYHATLRVRPVTDGNISFVEWSTTFDCDRDRIAEWEEFFSQEVFQGALDAVKEHFA